MALNVRQPAHLPVVYLDSIISTNNYAMQLINADTTQHGTLVVTDTQTGGKGQRGNAWMDEPGKSLLASVILEPDYLLEQQFLFAASIAVAVADFVRRFTGSSPVHIKWPNDIVINDKKAGGILIENVLRGNQWLYAVAGIGINVCQDHFPGSLPHATSLLLSSGSVPAPRELAIPLRDALLLGRPAPEEVMPRYNEYLFLRHANHFFSDDLGNWTALVEEVLPDGSLQLRHPDGRIGRYRHGAIRWQW